MRYSLSLELSKKITLGLNEFGKGQKFDTSNRKQVIWGNLKGTETMIFRSLLSPFVLLFSTRFTFLQKNFFSEVHWYSIIPSFTCLLSAFSLPPIFLFFFLYCVESFAWILCRCHPHTCLLFFISDLTSPFHHLLSFLIHPYYTLHMLHVPHCTYKLCFSTCVSLFQFELCSPYAILHSTSCGISAQRPLFQVCCLLPFLSHGCLFLLKPPSTFSSTKKRLDFPPAASVHQLSHNLIMSIDSNPSHSHILSSATFEAMYSCSLFLFHHTTLNFFPISIYGTLTPSYIFSLAFRSFSTKAFSGLIPKLSPFFFTFIAARGIRLTTTHTFYYLFYDHEECMIGWRRYIVV